MSLHAMGESKNDVWDELQRLDDEVKKLAVHADPGNAVSPLGVFEREDKKKKEEEEKKDLCLTVSSPEYQGAMFELENGKKGLVKIGTLNLDTEEDW